MNGTFKLSKEQDEMAYLTGKAPVSKMQNYQSEVISYTKGKGRITLTN